MKALPPIIWGKKRNKDFQIKIHIWITAEAVKGNFAILSDMRTPQKACTPAYS